VIFNSEKRTRCQLPAFKELRAQLVRWGFQVLKELLDPPVLKDSKETLEQMVLKDPKETLEQMGLKDLRVMQEQMGLKDLKVMWAHKEYRDQQLQRVIRV
jgi:hypothetical protein